MAYGTPLQDQVKLHHHHSAYSFLVLVVSCSCQEGVIPGCLYSMSLSYRLKYILTSCHRNDGLFLTHKEVKSILKCHHDAYAKH